MLRAEMKWAHALVLTVGFWVMGCGVETKPVTADGALTTGLNGNWLLTGTLPFVDPLNLGPHGFGLSMTFITTGSHLVGGGTTNFMCGAFVVGGSGDVVTGTIGSDGSFTAQSSTNPPLSALVLKGVVPAAGASSWNGSYTFTPNNSSCPQSLTGNFTAVRIADVTGAYATTAPVAVNPLTLGGTAQAISLAFSLTQGGVLPGTTAANPEVLSGSVTIKGSSCFQSGTATVAAGSGLLGSTLVTAFTLNDGSRMEFVGDVEDVWASRLVLHALIFSGGTCGTMSSGPFEVVKQ